jgi:divalent metal cation (Fe/Co/Zn/Cd) transporter
MGWKQADPLIGLVITVAILGVLRSATAQVGARLMDAVDPALVDQARVTLEKTPGIENVRELRLRWIGHALRAEADVSVDGSLTLEQAHDVAHEAEEQMIGGVRRLTAAAVHVSPAGAHDETA